MDYIWNITGKCNINCSYCWDKFKKEEDLSLEACKLIADKIAVTKPDMLLFTGGEPLVRKDFFQLIAHCQKRKIDNMKLCTNGLLVDHYLEEILTSGINEIHISLDNLSESDEQFRMKTTKVIENIHLLSKYVSSTLKVVIVTVVGPNNLKNFEEILLFAKQLNLKVSYQLAVDDEQNLVDWGVDTMDKQAQIQFFEALYLLRKKYKKIFDYFSVNYFHTAKKYILAGEIPNKCSAGETFQIVDPNGEYHDCYTCKKRTTATITDCFSSKCLIWFRSSNKAQIIAHLMTKE